MIGLIIQSVGFVVPNLSSVSVFPYSKRSNMLTNLGMKMGLGTIRGSLRVTKSELYLITASS